MTVFSLCEVETADLRTPDAQVGTQSPVDRTRCLLARTPSAENETPYPHLRIASADVRISDGVKRFQGS